MLIPMQRLSAWIAIILISREIAITALRGMAISEGIIIAASQWGKRKSLIETFALIALLVYYPFWQIQFAAIGKVLIGLTMIISLGSGVHYIWCFFSEVLERQKTPPQPTTINDEQIGD